MYSEVSRSIALHCCSASQLHFTFTAPNTSYHCIWLLNQLFRKVTECIAAVLGCGLVEKVHVCVHSNLHIPQRMFGQRLLDAPRETPGHLKMRK